MRLALLLASLACLVAVTLPARAFDTRAPSAWVYDVNTGTVLLEKQADIPLPPASMSKIMTLNMLFEALRDGRVTLDTPFRVSARAQAMGGSTMFLDQSDRPTVEELIKGIVVLSGNDACVVVAEGLAGTEDAFARLMNQRGKDLGLQHSTFANASGWPNPNHRMSMQDLGMIAVRLIKEFPEYYGYFGMTEFPYDGRAPQNRFNRNPLLSLGIGADGLKTGHTREAGYGLVGSALQGNRRVVFVISGLDSEQARAEEAERIVAWAFRQFVHKTVVKQGDVVAEAPVWLGDAESVGLAVTQDLDLLLPALVQDGVEGEVVYEGPFEAPIEAGQELGTLIIRLPDLPETRVPLVADRSVGTAGFLPRVRLAAEILWDMIAGRAAEVL